MEDKYAIAEALYEDLEYKKSFSLFQEIALDTNNSNVTRADAYNMMGILVECCDPSLASGDDESGLEHYKAALELDENNLSALANVLGSFGESFPHHQDTAAFRAAYNKAMLLQDEFTKGEIQRWQEKYQLMQRMAAKGDATPPRPMEQ